MKQEKPVDLQKMVREMYALVRPEFCYNKPVECARVVNEAYIRFREAVDCHPEVEWAQYLLDDVVRPALQVNASLEYVSNPTGGCMAVLLVLDCGNADEMSSRVKTFDACVSALVGAETDTMRLIQQGLHAFTMVEKISAPKMFRVEVDFIPVLRGDRADKYLVLSPQVPASVVARAALLASEGKIDESINAVYEGIAAFARVTSVVSACEDDRIDGGNEKNIINENYRLTELSIMKNQDMLQDLVDDCPKLPDVLSLFLAMQHYGAFHRAPALLTAHALSFHAVVLDLVQQMGHREFIDWWRYSEFAVVFLTICLEMVRHFTDDVKLTSVTHDQVDAVRDVRTLDKATATQYYTDWITNSLSFSMLFH